MNEIGIKEFPNCEHCGIVIDRDVNAAISDKYKNDGVPGLLSEKSTL